MSLEIFYATRKISQYIDNVEIKMQQLQRIEVTGASVGTRLDYCNAILAGTADTVIKRLQSV